MISVRISSVITEASSVDQQALLQLPQRQSTLLAVPDLHHAGCGRPEGPRVVVDVAAAPIQDGRVVEVVAVGDEAVDVDLAGGADTPAPGDALPLGDGAPCRLGAAIARARDGRVVDELVDEVLGLGHALGHGPGDQASLDQGHASRGILVAVDHPSEGGLVEGDPDRHQRSFTRLNDQSETSGLRTGFSILYFTPPGSIRMSSWAILTALPRSSM